MIYPHYDPKDVPLSKQVGYYRGPGHDEIATREIADLTQQVETLRRQLGKTHQELQALRARAGVLLTVAVLLLVLFGVWLAAITVRMAVHHG